MSSETVTIDGRGVVQSVRLGPTAAAVEFEFYDGSALVEFEGEPLGIEQLRGPGSIQVLRRAMRHTPKPGEDIRVAFTFSRERGT